MLSSFILFLFYLVSTSKVNYTMIEKRPGISSPLCVAVTSTSRLC